MSAVRPLPPRPNLEFEHKEAKALLRQLRAGDPEAIARARARHSTIDASDPARIRLADAQLVIAREYGFTSWPRLVRYFGEVDRQRHNPLTIQSSERDYYDVSVQSLLGMHRSRRVWAARALASYVPRFYGMRADDVFAATITEEDARLAVARRNGFPSFEVLLDRIAEGKDRFGVWEVDPMKYAGEAMDAGDLDELRRVIETHPDLLHPTDHEVAMGRSLLALAVGREQRHGAAAMRPIVDWLATQGLDIQLELNRQLCGHMRMKTEKVQWLLDRGADPNWIAPNGIPVLEHALIRYWNGEAADLVAARVAPRDGLWIAAGLGDVDGVRRFLDANGKPTPAARQLRPDFDAVSRDTMAPNPDPDDEEILIEAFYIAVLNSRTAVLEYMVSRGFNIDSLAWGSPIIHMPIGNAMTSVVDCLIHCGADLDLHGWHPDSSARELARSLFESMPHDPDRRRIVELCGLAPDAILAERDARPVNPPGIAPDLQQALELAGDDAFRLGQPDIREENLLFGLLRNGKLPVLYFTKASRIDLDRFRSAVADRIRPGEERVERPKLPIHPDAQATIRFAIGIAGERRREAVNGLHLLYALTRTDDGPAGDLLTRHGSSASKLNAELKRVV
jgi:hypothetical protein